MRFLNIVLIFIALASNVWADDKDFFPLDPPIQTQKFNKVGIDPDKEIRLTIENFYQTGPSYSNYWTLLYQEPKSYYQVEYKGLPKFLSGRTKSFANKYYKSWLKDYLNNSFTDEDYKTKLKILDAEDNATSKWQRNFWEYDSQTGSSDKIQTIGQDIRLIDVAGFNLYSSGKVKLDDFDVALAKRDNDYNLTDKKLTELEKVSFELSTPDTSFPFDGSIKIKGKLGFNIRTDTKENASSIKASVSVTIGKVPWMRVVVKGEIHPFQNQHSLNIGLELLRF